MKNDKKYGKYFRVRKIGSIFSYILKILLPYKFFRRRKNSMIRIYLKIERGSKKPIHFYFPLNVWMQLHTKFVCHADL